MAVLSWFIVLGQITLSHTKIASFNMFVSQVNHRAERAEGLNLGQLNGISPVADFDEKSGLSCSNNDYDHHFAYQAKPLDYYLFTGERRRIIKICGFKRSLINKLVPIH